MDDDNTSYHIKIELDGSRVPQEQRFGSRLVKTSGPVDHSTARFVRRVLAYATGDDGHPSTGEDLVAILDFLLLHLDSSSLQKLKKLLEEATK